MKFNSRDYVSLEPMFRILPAFSYHTLGCKIHDIFCFGIMNKIHYFIQAVIKIKLIELEFASISFFIGKESVMWFWGPTDTDTFYSIGQ